MITTSLESKSYWLSVRGRGFRKLTGNIDVDVGIIGGGITGLTAAYLLKQAGKRVAVLDKHGVGDAETGHTTGHLSMVTDLRLHDIVRNFGEDEARAVWQAGATAIDLIEQITHEHSIDCDFRRVPGFLHAALLKDRGEQDELQAEAELARRLGFEARYLSSAPVVRQPAIRFANQALFHPLKYIKGLAEAVNSDGSAIFGRSEATEVQSEPLSLVVGKHKVRCQKLIIATHVPLIGEASLPRATLLQSKLAGYSTYAIAALAPKRSLPAASFWDTDDPYFYLRVNPLPRNDLLIFGGMDHKTGQHTDPERCFADLERLLLELVPKAKVKKRWSGQVIESNDGLPFIGPETDHQFVATGYGGNGLTFGTLAGMMACDWALGRENPWQELFAIERKKLSGAWDYLKENLAYPYHLVRGFLHQTGGDDLDSVAKGEGKILKLDGQRCAVYRDPEGALEIRSAICTHMGCVVRWNDAEKSWDCPCHGSRFNPQGGVMAGPAETPLAEHSSPTALD
jgi:glycine/D-amino acid oxidase-like deaminating enzyme/nitrite reductase/ring-hydroxylating ferredoxin subunit